MFSEEWLRVLQADREREIEAARRAHEARTSAPRHGRFRAWFDGHFGEERTPPASRPQTGRAATDPSA
jgi:hypothetical protein